MTLTNAQRAALRRAISASPQWPAYRRANGNLTTADLGSARALEVAAILSIDTAAILGAAPMLATPAPIAPQGLFNNAAPAPALNSDTQAALAALRQLEAALLNPQPQAPAFDPVLIAGLTARLDALEAAQNAPRLLVVDTTRKPLGDELPAMRHGELENFIRAMSARDGQGRALNTWISGPAGSGKTHGVKQAAKALGLDFYLQGPALMPHEYLGFVDAHGRLIETPFTRAWKNGGVVLLDELDRCGVEATLALNTPLDGDLLPLPDGSIVERHPDFICVGTANTWGSGDGRAEYVGANKLDGAFRNRFIPNIAWAYDEKLESEISGNPDFARRVQKARKAAEKAGLKVLITPRHSVGGAALIRAGFTADDAAAKTYLAALSDAQRAMVEV